MYIYIYIYIYAHIPIDQRDYSKKDREAPVPN